MRGERLFIRGGALAPYDQDDRRAQPRVGDAESHGFMDQPPSDGGGLDHRRAAAIAPCLSHRIDAADAAKQTLVTAPTRIPPHHPHHRLAPPRPPRPETPPPPA